MDESLHSVKYIEIGVKNSRKRRQRLLNVNIKAYASSVLTIIYSMTTSLVTLSINDFTFSLSVFLWKRKKGGA